MATSVEMRFVCPIGKDCGVCQFQVSEGARTNAIVATLSSRMDVP